MASPAARAASRSRPVGNAPEPGGDAGFLVSLRAFLRHPSMVGSAFPATDRMVRHVLDPLDWPSIRVLVEFGPGSGQFTRAALARMDGDALLVAIDTSEIFTRHLQREIADPRLRAVTGSAEDIAAILAGQGVTRADCILSGLPFSTIPPGLAARIMDASRAVLPPHGCFAAYQMRTAIKPWLAARFGHLRHGYEMWNIPPCHLYWASGGPPDAPA
ncbi:MAG: methyltransferase [Sphingobium sp.]